MSSLHGGCRRQGARSASRQIGSSRRKSLGHIGDKRMAWRKSYVVLEKCKRWKRWTTLYRLCGSRRYSNRKPNQAACTYIPQWEKKNRQNSLSPDEFLGLAAEVYGGLRLPKGGQDAVYVGNAKVPHRLPLEMETQTWRLEASAEPTHRRPAQVEALHLGFRPSAI